MNLKHLDARWRNAIQKFTHLQKIIDEGYVLRNGVGRRVNKIEIAGDIINLVLDGRSHEVYTWKDERCYRMELTIPMFNAALAHWHYYPTLAVRPAFTVEELMK